MNQKHKQVTNGPYGKSPAPLHGDAGLLPIISNGSPQPQTTRRDFLALAGFTLAAGLTACNRAPVQNAIPMVAGSPENTPGVPSWYATTCGGCSSACSLLVKTRDGRPIKIEGNPQSSLFGGGTCALGQATVLSLYDDERLRGPLWRGQKISWDEIDRHVLDSLATAAGADRAIVLLSGTIVSPSTRNIIATWRRRYPTFKHVSYDPVSLSALQTANAECFGRAGLPHYRFDKARAIVGIDADFLATWLSPVEFARQYAENRKPEVTKRLSHHIQFEPGFSITGSNADLRVPVAPADLGAVVVALLRRIAERAGIGRCPQGPEPLSDGKLLDSVADCLWRNRGEALIVSGVQDVDVQTSVFALNEFLGNIGKTVDLTSLSLQRCGNDKDVANLVGEMEQGRVGVLMIYGPNPVYDLAESNRLLRAMEKVPLSLSFSDRRDETSSLVDVNCPDHHFLESWGDAEPIESHFSLLQPTISPLFDTRSAQESLLRWIGEPTSYYSYLREFWQRHLFPRQEKIEAFDSFWDTSLRDGMAVLPHLGAQAVMEFQGDWRAAASRVIEENRHARAARSDNRYEMHLYESAAIRDGHHANNPWLQELPDPITKVTWGNFAAVSPALASRLGLHEGDVIRLTTEANRIEMPVFIQPGQHEHTISVAVGYGRRLSGRVGDNVGINVYPLTAFQEGLRQYAGANVALEKTYRRDALATTQTHFSLEGRPIIKEQTAAEIEHTLPEPAVALPSLWPARPEGEHAWGMIIDLSACTGCSACVIACQAENNVAVVGKDQVQRTREMHWIRIDRYYNGPEDNPRSVHQPMMCQHCGNAPCETVCPVLATTHSSDGLNQQVYNRCIGTRYCANNCPYKVRRFNWLQYSENPKFDFTMENDLDRMVLNPDVTVRSRGVMEKCSLCVQRIQAAKNLALQETRSVVDGDIQTACQQACPSQAIVFGDLKDPHSRISILRTNPRYYSVLAELGTAPNVGYLTKVRNPLET